MTKRLILCVGVCILTAEVWAGPKVELDRAQIDLGMVQSGVLVNTSVAIRNAGDAPLVIDRVQVSCPCTKAAAPSGEAATIAPGGEFRLPIQYDTEDRHGSYGSSIVIYTNDPVTPISIVELGVEIQKRVLVNFPAGIEWGIAAKGTTLQQVLTFKPGDPSHEIELVSIAMRSSGIEVSAKRVAGDGQPRIEAAFTLAPDLPLGQLENEVLARVWAGGEEMEFTLPVSGTVIGDVLITPPSIISPRTAYRPGQKISEITVQSSTGGDAPEVLGAMAVGPLSAVIHKDRAPEKYSVAVHAGDAAQAGARSGTVYVMTASADEPIVAVPVYFRMGDSVAAQPDHLVFETDGGEQRVELRNVVGEAVRITNVRFEGDVIRATVVRDAQSAAEPAVVSVAPAKGRNLDKATTILVIETDCPSAREVYVPVLIR